MLFVMLLICFYVVMLLFQHYIGIIDPDRGRAIINVGKYCAFILAIYTFELIINKYIICLRVL